MAGLIESTWLHQWRAGNSVVGALPVTPRKLTLEERQFIGLDIPARPTTDGNDRRWPPADQLGEAWEDATVEEWEETRATVQHVIDIGVEDRWI